MQNRKNALAMLGMLPKRNGKGGYKAIVEWYLELEAIIKSIQSMGDKDINMQGEAFSQSSFIAIQKMFPPREMLKLSNIPGNYNSDLMDAYLEKIAVFRNEAQKLQIVFDSNAGPLTPKLHMIMKRKSLAAQVILLVLSLISHQEGMKTVVYAIRWRP